MPQIGQLPGLVERTSGCIGQVHSAAGDGGAEDEDEDEDGDEDGDEDEDGRRRSEVSGWAWCIPRGAVDDSTPSGSALNRFKQPILQK
jgi:hypothetical protein